MKEYIFSIGYDAYQARVALTGEWSLYDFAEFIIASVGFDFDHCFEFCDNLKNPHRSKQRYTLFADIGEDADDPGVKNTRISDVFGPGQKMAFHFDYGDDWYFLITCIAVAESASKRRSRKVLGTEGTAPVQYPAYEEDDT